MPKYARARKNTFTLYYFKLALLYIIDISLLLFFCTWPKQMFAQWQLQQRTSLTACWHLYYKGKEGGEQGNDYVHEEKHYGGEAFQNIFLENISTACSSDKSAKMQRPEI